MWVGRGSLLKMNLFLQNSLEKMIEIYCLHYHFVVVVDFDDLNAYYCVGCWSVPLSHEDF